MPGARHVDARVPVSILNFAWHRLEWPPVTGSPARWISPSRCTPLLMPARRAARFVTIHDLYFLDHPEQTAAEIRRDYPALAGRMRGGPTASSCRPITPKPPSRIASVFAPDRIIVCSPGAPAWAAREEPAAGPAILFVGTVEPRKNIPGLLKRYAALVRRRSVDTPTSCLPAAPRPAVDARSTVDGVSLAGRVQVARICRRRASGSRSIERRRCWCCRPLTRDSAFPCSRR